MFFTPIASTNIAAPNATTDRVVLRRARRFFERHGFEDVPVDNADSLVYGSLGLRGNLRVFVGRSEGRRRIGFEALGKCSEAREADVDRPSGPGPRKPGSDGPAG